MSVLVHLKEKHFPGLEPGIRYGVAYISKPSSILSCASGHFYCHLLYQTWAQWQTVNKVGCITNLGLEAEY